MFAGPPHSFRRHLHSARLRFKPRRSALTSSGKSVPNSKIATESQDACAIGTEYTQVKIKASIRLNRLRSSFANAFLS